MGLFAASEYLCGRSHRVLRAGEERRRAPSGAAHGQETRGNAGPSAFTDEDEAVAYLRRSLKAP
jgi:hypothetical protein